MGEEMVQQWRLRERERLVVNKQQQQQKQKGRDCSMRGGVKKVRRMSTVLVERGNICIFAKTICEIVYNCKTTIKYNNNKSPFDYYNKKAENTTTHSWIPA